MNDRDRRKHNKIISDKLGNNPINSFLCKELPRNKCPPLCVLTKSDCRASDGNAGMKILELDGGKKIKTKYTDYSAKVVKPRKKTNVATKSDELKTISDDQRKRLEQSQKKAELYAKKLKELKGTLQKTSEKLATIEGEIRDELGQSAVGSKKKSAKIKPINVYGGGSKRVIFKKNALPDAFKPFDCLENENAKPKLLSEKANQSLKKLDYEKTGIKKTGETLKLEQLKRGMDLYTAILENARKGGQLEVGSKKSVTDLINVYDGGSKRVTFKKNVLPDVKQNDRFEDEKAKLELLSEEANQLLKKLDNEKTGIKKAGIGAERLIKEIKVKSAKLEATKGGNDETLKIKTLEQLKGGVDLFQGIISNQTAELENIRKEVELRKKEIGVEKSKLNKLMKNQPRLVDPEPVVNEGLWETVKNAVTSVFVGKGELQINDDQKAFLTDVNNKFADAGNRLEGHKARLEDHKTQLEILQTAMDKYAEEIKKN